MPRTRESRQTNPQKHAFSHSQGHDLPFAAQKNDVCFRPKLPFLKA
jgi:hypothetical protein